MRRARFKSFTTLRRARRRRRFSARSARRNRIFLVHRARPPRDSKRAPLLSLSLSPPPFLVSFPPQPAPAPHHGSTPLYSLLEEFLPRHVASPSDLRAGKFERERKKEKKKRRIRPRRIARPPRFAALGAREDRTPGSACGGFCPPPPPTPLRSLAGDFWRLKISIDEYTGAGARTRSEFSCRPESRSPLSIGRSDARRHGRKVVSKIASRHAKCIFAPAPQIRASQPPLLQLTAPIKRQKWPSMRSPRRSRATRRSLPPLPPPARQLISNR